MFGMTSDEFWEQDPMLYWSYRIFYLKKLEQEDQIKTEALKYESWLNGELTYIACSTAIGNAFSKTKHEFPKMSEIFRENVKKVDKKDKKTLNNIVQEEFNAWARL